MVQAKTILSVIFMFLFMGTLNVLATQLSLPEQDAAKVARILEMRSGKNLQGFRVSVRVAGEGHWNIGI